MLAVALFLSVGLMMFSAGPARAADKPFEIEFNKSTINIGGLGSLLGGLPLDQVASGGSIKGTVAPDGTVTIPKGAFTMPELGLDDPVKFRVFMGIEGPATGTFNSSTGQLELDTKAGLWLQVDAAALLDLLGVNINDLLGGLGGGSGGGGFNIGGLITPLLSNLTCGFSPMNVHFTTGTNSLATGAPFVDGTTGAGALTTEWSKLGPFSGRTKILGIFDPCQMLVDYLPGLIQGGAGGALPGGIDLGGLDLAGLLANLDNLDLGPSSITLTRSVAPTPPAAGRPLLRVTVKPMRRNYRANQKARVRVTVRNAGDAPARSTRVCVVSTATGSSCENLGPIPAGASRTRSIRVNLKAGRLTTRKRVHLKVTVTARKARPVVKSTRALLIRA